MKDIPLVTVLMPVYNSEMFLRDAIESILNQTYNNIEFLIINDGSTDSSENIILDYIHDRRIIYVINPENIKLIDTLNRGIAISKGKYIVRMDSDDISLPNRIEDLVTFMEKDENKKVGVCGSFFKKIGVKEEEVKYPVSDSDLRFALFFYNPICHPTSIWRKSIINRHNLKFKREYLHAEEYEFWVQISEVSEIKNIDRVLLKYREHSLQVSNLHAKIQKETARKVRSKLLLQIDESLSENHFDLWEKIILNENHENHENHFISIQFIEHLILKNEKNKVIDNIYFKKKLLKISKKYYFNLNKLTLFDFIRLLTNPFYKDYNWTLKQLIAFSTKIKII
jgi:glycosyltransferase involved in cell wall biosynthesis